MLFWGGGGQFPFDDARNVILHNEGVYFLYKEGVGAQYDFDGYYQTCGDDMFPTVVEALILALHANDRYHRGLVPKFTQAVNVILGQERVGWEVIEGEMVEIHSKELHTEVVEPALQLLHRPEFAGAEAAYRSALEETAQGNAADAITDAGTALQETLTTIGCEGNQLGDLIRSARKKGVLAPHDEPMAKAIDAVLNWVAADRSQMGDSHHASEARSEDAWLIVHVVGALIVRFASREARA
jgi:uncharacterized protein YehS (DUF1456 family)